jgi:cytochrome c
VSEFTDYGKWARDRGYGCTNLLSLIKLHNVKGPAMERAREVFVQNKCSVCHNVEGKGIGKENLTTYGLRMKKENLGCAALYKSLLGK